MSCNEKRDILCQFLLLDLLYEGEIKVKEA